jgi:hypothetical protein
MGSTFHMEITGLDRAQGVLKRMKEAIQDEVNLEIQVAAFAMQKEAKKNIQRNGTIDQGFLTNSITVVQNVRTRTFEILCTAYYAPFMEFGTGIKVAVPPEWSEFASQYKAASYSRGTIDEFFDSLFDWSIRKGIEPDKGQTREQMVRWMMIVILTEGLKPRPFFYPAFVKTRRELIERINNVIKRSTGGL